uniref:Uncharacterized protein n=1 Tax=Rhizophora mucronata TaxID=61149 RepID=A0A2P2MXP8_RHIMU
MTFIISIFLYQI